LCVIDEQFYTTRAKYHRTYLLRTTLLSYSG